jgi:hypothetical protein
MAALDWRVNMQCARDRLASRRAYLLVRPKVRAPQLLL